MQTTYIGPERQLSMPLGLRPLTTEEAALKVVDELHTALLTFKHTRLKKDFLHMIERALYLQRLGYVFFLDRRHNCVGAHRAGPKGQKETVPLNSCTSVHPMRRKEDTSCLEH